MTTIAWDGRVLAADKRATGGAYNLTITKIRRYADGRLAGFCGHVVNGMKLLKWLEEKRPKKAPKFGNDDDDIVYALEIMPDGSVIRYTPEGTFPLDNGPAALGTGGPFAVAAMRCGRGAAGAIKVAAEFDSNTGNGVDTLTL